MAERKMPLTFEFQVPATATVQILGLNAAEAWSAVGRTFGRLSAGLATGPQDGLELVDLHLLGPATLASIDGENPVAGLEAALDAHRRRGDPTS